jgi:hypothetical protein
MTMRVAASEEVEEPLDAAPDHESGSPWFRGRHVSKSTLVELGVLLALLVAYTAIRAAQGTDVGAAFSHARWIASSEDWLLDNLELPLNKWFASVAVVAVPACYFYAVFHYVATPAILYRSWRVGGWIYKRGYWTIVIASAIALVIYSQYPVAPPRLVSDLGAVDIMRKFADYGWWGEAASAPRAIGDATNQYAAMPSLHFGWSLWCGIQMWSFTGIRWRTAAIVYPTLQVLVVVGTANHFVLDVVGGGLCVLAAMAVVLGVRHLLRRTRNRAPATA